MITKEDFLEFCKESNFRIDKYQEKIIDHIFEDIKSQTLISIIFMPNATGKTNLSVLLSCYLQKSGEVPLLYSPMKTKEDYSYNQLVKTNEKYFSQIDFANAGDVIEKKKGNKQYDYIIADGISYTDINHIDKREIVELIQSFTTNGTCDSVNDVEAKLQWIGQRILSKITVASKAKVIIFMKRRDAELCRNTTFMLSTKKNEIDVFPEDESIENEHSLDLQNAKSLLKDIAKKFENQLERIESKVDDVNQKIDVIHEVVQEIRSNVSNQKQFLSTYLDLFDDENIEDLIEKVVNKISNQISANIVRLEDLDAYKKYYELVKIRMGEDAWGKLDKESKRFLVTAKLTFSQNILFGGNDIDYSSICLLASKAFEIELAKRFVGEYTVFLNKELGSNLEKWPSVVVKKTKKGTLRTIEINEFMLGSCSYIFGILDTKMRDKAVNRKYFIKYCREVLVKKSKCSELDEIINELDKEIKIVKDNFRNPAAHKNSISMLKASACIDYILEIERVLKYMLEMFNF